MTSCRHVAVLAMFAIFAAALLPTSLAAKKHYLMPHHGRWLLQTANLTTMCASEGPAASATFMNATKTCLQFYSKGAAIHVPSDTKIIKYGQIYPSSMNPGITVLVDRKGKEYNISAKAKPPTDMLQLMKIWVLLVVRAELVNNTVVSFKPVLYVPYKTIMTTMINTQFEGKLYNADPRPAGPQQTSWFRWSFGANITVTDPTNKYGTLLRGTFDNLFTPIKDAKGKCQPALCADLTRKSAACKYYMEYFGNGTRMTLSWDPNMHMATDTELVPMFDATQRQYMSRFTELFRFLNARWQFVPRKYVLVSHGTPMGVPQNFTGTLAPLKKAESCKL